MIRHVLVSADAHRSLVVGACVAVVLLLLLVHIERQRRPVIPVLLALGVVAFDAGLYPGTGQLVSVFHPSAGGQNIRLSQVIIALAVIARVWVRGLPRRAHPVMLLWWVFFAWYAVAAITGILNGNNTQLVTSRAILVLEAGGMIVLASGVPARDFLEDRAVPRFVLLCGALAGVIGAMSVAHVSLTTSVPLLPLLDFGVMGSDAATLFPAIGLLGFALELPRPRRRPLVLVASTVLVLAVMASAQRAARLGLLVAFAFVLIAALWPWRRRLRMRAFDVAAIITCLIGAVAAGVFVRAAANHSRAPLSEAIPFSRYMTQAISNSYRQGSVQSRYNEWRAALTLVRDHPWAGNGLGKTFLHYDVGTRSWIDYDITNNIPLDLLLRTGAIGVVLFLVALVLTFAGAWQVWRRTGDDARSILAITAAAVLADFLAKGMVESVLNEFRMTPLFGFLIGLILSLGTREREPRLRQAEAGSPQGARP